MKIGENEQVIFPFLPLFLSFSSSLFLFHSIFYHSIFSFSVSPLLLYFTPLFSSLSSSRRLPSRLLLLYFFVLVFFSLHFFRFLSSFWNMSPLPWVAAFNRTKKWRKMKNLISCPVIIYSNGCGIGGEVCL